MWVHKLAEFIMGQLDKHWSIIVFVGIAMIAGLISQMIMPGRGFGLLATIAIGLVGCLIGNYFIVEYISFTDNILIKKIIAGTAGTMLLTFPINLLRPGKDKDKTKYRNNT